MRRRRTIYDRPRIAKGLRSSNDKLLTGEERTHYSEAPIPLAWRRVDHPHHADYLAAQRAGKPIRVRKSSRKHQSSKNPQHNPRPS